MGQHNTSASFMGNQWAIEVLGDVEGSGLNVVRTIKLGRATGDGLQWWLMCVVPCLLH